MHPRRLMLTVSVAALIALAPGAAASAQTDAPSTGGLGTVLADILQGTPAADVLSALDGDDTVRGGAGNDQLDGASGNDRLFGDAGSDTLLGRSGDDRLAGGAGKDILDGGSGDDRIDARDATKDTIVCGSGRDVVTADAKDSVSADCDVVRRPHARAKRSARR